MTRWLRLLGGRCAARPFVVIAVWVGIAVGLTVLSLTVGGDYTHSSTLPGTEVERAEQALAAHLPEASHESAEVLVHAATPAAASGATSAVQQRIAALPQVGSVVVTRWSADRTTGWLHVTYDQARMSVGHAQLAALQRAARSAPGAQGYVVG